MSVRPSVALELHAGAFEAAAVADVAAAEDDLLQAADDGGLLVHDEDHR